VLFSFGHRILSRLEKMTQSAQGIKYLVACIVLSIVLISCSAESQLPQGARDALNEHWQTLPTVNSSEYRIVRAWPGEMSSENLTPWAPSTEIWCVEVELSIDQAGSEEPEKMIWIVTRQDEESTWYAALLMAMSSIWPYQACGVVP
jgi:hypothetical protein